MHIRIRLSRPVVKEMEARLRHAYEMGDVRLVRRISVLLGYLEYGIPLAQLIQAWGISQATFYVWIKHLLLKGLDSLVYQHGGGRKPKLTPSQKELLCRWIDAGPQACGFPTGCWSSLPVGKHGSRSNGQIFCARPKALEP